MVARHPDKEIELVPEPQFYITPSFSWAAKDPRFIGYRIESTDTIWDSPCEIIDIRVPLSASSGSFGSVASGKLTMRGPIKKARWTVDYDRPWLCHLQPSNQDGLHHNPVFRYPDICHKKLHTARTVFCFQPVSTSGLVLERVGDKVYQRCGIFRLSGSNVMGYFYLSDLSLNGLKDIAQS